MAPRQRKVREIGEDTGLGIDIDGDGKSDFSINLKTIGMLIAGIVTLVGFAKDLVVMKILLHLNF